MIVAKSEVAQFMNKAVRETILLILIAVIVFLGMRFSVQTYIVYGPSMQPNYVANEWVIVNKLVYKLHAPNRGDIIVLRPPIENGKNLIKRVIGLPGESVEIKNGVVYIYKTDGTILKLDESYVKYVALQDFSKHPVLNDRYFVLGDNRNNSDDSRTGWTALRSEIIGKAWLDIWPPSRWGLAPNYRLPK